MICRYCQCDPDPAIVIPELCEDVDISESVFACVPCALERGIYCPLHSRAHCVFLPDGKTACLTCIEYEAHELYAQFDDLMIELKKVNRGELTRLMGATAVLLIGLGMPAGMTICRWIATRMVVYHMTLDDVIAEIIKRDKFDLIVPSEIYDGI